MSKLNYIAELCQNHQGKMKNIEKMIYECVKAGATTIKMQYIFSKNLSFRPQFEFGAKIRNKRLIIKRPFSNEYKRLRGLDIPNSYYKNFLKICEKNRVTAAITCFAREHIDILRDLGFTKIKIASYDCSSYRLLEEVSKKFEHLIISTGATYDEELLTTAKLLKNLNVNFSMLHCVTIYPTPINYLNLNRINYLKKITKNIGYSDHSLAYGKNKHLASMFAIYFGAKIIERHIRIADIHETKDGPVSLLPDEISEVIEFSKLSKKDMLIYLKDKFPINRNIVGGKSSRSLTRLEILNRDYYRGRFCSFTKKNKIPIYNWEETSIN